jgi:hypothetical protein
MLLKRIRVVAGANPRRSMACTHCSKWPGRSRDSGTSAKEADVAASRMACAVAGCQRCRCERSA